MMAQRNPDPPPFMRGLRGRLLGDEPRSRQTSWRVGGAADYFYAPADKADWLQLLARLPGDLPLCWVGLGSNLLVRDGGVAGMVVRTSQGLRALRFSAAGRGYVEAGVSCAKVARTAAAGGLTGVEFLAGVPGSFGGALAMNAGAFGGETWDWVETVECVNRAGQCRMVRAAEIPVGYRRVDLPDDGWLLSAEIVLQPGGPGGGRQRIRSLLEKRNATQPVQSASAGPVFRNPPGGHAAKRIEQSGLKGARIGDAVISETHANFIVNAGSATAADIERLIDLVKRRVKARTGVELIPEVRIIGRPA